MENMVQAQKKIALLHRHPPERIKETNAAFPFLQAKGIDVLTFKKFERTGGWKKFWKSILWIFYAPLLVIGKGYDVIYCDDSYPFYPIFVKLVSPRSKVVLRLGDLHLMYYYSGLAYKILHLIEKIGWLLADEILAISQPMAEYVSRETGKKIEVVLDPVNPKDFPLARGRRRNYGTVMFHGLLTKNKGVDVILDAAKMMPEQTFFIVGDGPDRQRLESLAPKNVLFYGWVPFNEIPILIDSCAVGVALRSDNPGNQYVVTSPFLQYGVMGKPCLVTPRKVFGDYEWQFSGLVELVSKLKVLLMRPFEEGEKLKKHVLKNHNAEKIAEEIWSLLSS